MGDTSTAVLRPLSNPTIHRIFQSLAGHIPNRTE